MILFLFTFLISFNVEKKGFSALRIFLIALIIYMSGELIFTVYYYISTKKESHNLTAKISDIKTQNDKIKKEIQLANTQEFIEKIARENLMLAKDGETIVYFKWDKNQNSQPVSSQSENFLKKFFDNLLKLFQK
jgi:cell division protein FtsB